MAVSQLRVSRLDAHLSSGSDEHTSGGEGRAPGQSYRGHFADMAMRNLKWPQHAWADSSERRNT